MRARVRASGASSVRKGASGYMKDRMTAANVKPKQAIYKQHLICDHSPGNTSQ